jgi:hypothetical protein
MGRQSKAAFLVPCSALLKTYTNYDPVVGPKAVLSVIATFRQPACATLAVTQLAKKAAIFFQVVLNGTWTVMAYLLHKVGVLFEPSRSSSRSA